MANNDPRNIFVDQRNDYNGENKGNGTGDNATQSGGSQSNNSAQKSNANVDDYTRRVEEMKRLAEKYQREGEGQLVKDIVNNVIEQKARGALTNEQLVAFAKRVSPLLNNEQRGRLNELVSQLIKL